MSAQCSRLGEVLDELASVISMRRDADPEASYTARLLTGHEDKLLKKIGEEATEVVMAVKDHDRGQVRYESADLIYHLLVVLEREGVSLDSLAEELEGRRR
jgi:phosphoribosyl-ATP pyrophosphohydrolase